MKKNLIKDILLATLAVTITAGGIHFFLIPNRFATNGVFGLSMILCELTNFYKIAVMMIIINAFFALLAIIFLRKKINMLTIYSELMVVLVHYLMEEFLPVEYLSTTMSVYGTYTLTNEPFMELFVGLLLFCVGNSLIFNIGATFSGYEILSELVNKFTSFNGSILVVVLECLISMSTIFLFDVKSCLFSMFGLFVKTFLIDGVIESLTLCKYFTIITEKPEEISQYIINEIKRGVTEQDAIGVYTQSNKKVLLTVCNRSQANRLKNKIKTLDPYAFFMITNTSEIIGKGFSS